MRPFNKIKVLKRKITFLQNYSLHLNGFLKKSASHSVQNRSSHSPAMPLCRASCPPPCGSATLFQIAPGDLVTMFAQSVLLNFSRKTIPFMNIRAT